jgi:hypothetical protein
MWALTTASRVGLHDQQIKFWVAQLSAHVFGSKLTRSGTSDGLVQTLPPRGPCSVRLLPKKRSPHWGAGFHWDEQAACCQLPSSSVPNPPGETIASSELQVCQAAT